MSKHSVQVDWARDGTDSGPGYDRSHIWRFDSGTEVAASSAPHLHGDPTRVDPEEAFVAAISSCHMLWFLHLASDGGWIVDRYVDDAVGTMARNESGAICITDVDLRPTIEWSGDTPSSEEVQALHHESHRQCFIANSVKTTITVNGL
jgi:organic hydroperoxide reductase OsmC/OhrA